MIPWIPRWIKESASSLSVSHSCPLLDIGLHQVLPLHLLERYFFSWRLFIPSLHLVRGLPLLSLSSPGFHIISLSHQRFSVIRAMWPVHLECVILCKNKLFSSCVLCGRSVFCLSWRLPTLLSPFLYALLSVCLLNVLSRLRLRCRLWSLVKHIAHTISNSNKKEYLT